MAHRPTPGQVELDQVQAYINGQPDALTAMVKHRTDTKGHLGDLYIQSFDPEGKFLTVVLRPPPKCDEVIMRIPFNPPVTNIFHVRPHLLQWRDLANKHFKVPDVPQVYYYKTPALFPFAAPAVIGLVALFFALFGWGEWADLFRTKIVLFFGPYAIRAATAFAIACHGVIEPAYMLWATRKHRVPLGPRIKWILTTVVLGMAAINEMWECVQYERIRHVYRQTDVGDIGPLVRESVPVTAEKKEQ